MYYRLHGAPRRYWSVYTDERIDAWAKELRALPSTVAAWCIFDNTAGGGAIRNALRMQAQLRAH